MRSDINSGLLPSCLCAFICICLCGCICVLLVLMWTTCLCVRTCSVCMYLFAWSCVSPCPSFLDCDCRRRPNQCDTRLSSKLHQLSSLAGGALGQAASSASESKNREPKRSKKFCGCSENSMAAAAATPPQLIDTSQLQQPCPPPALRRPPTPMRPCLGSRL